MWINGKFVYMDEAMDEGAAAGGAGDVDTSDEVNVEATAEAEATNEESQSGSEQTEKEGYWPEDWRTRLAGEDDKTLKRLERYGSPTDIAKALIAAQNKIRSGEIVSKLSDNPSDEELAEYRKQNGIPEDPSGYGTDLGDGIVIGEEDKEIIGVIDEALHGVNATPEVRNAGLRAYYQAKEIEAEQQAEFDSQAQEKGEDYLREEWGGEFRTNITRIHNYLDSKMDQDTKELFLSGRLADGTPIGSHPELLNALLNTALEVNPSGTVVSATGGDIMGSVEDEIAQIEKTMRTNRQEYNRDEKMQARYRQLLAHREKAA